MSGTDYSFEYRQLDNAEMQIRQAFARAELEPARIGVLDQELAEIWQIRFWLEAGGSGIRSALVPAIDALVERVAQDCAAPRRPE